MGIKGKAIRDAFEWHPVEKNRIYVVEKGTGNVLKTKYMSEDPFSFFHFGNCYEENDQIVFDIMTYHAFANEDSSELQRFVVPVVTSNTQNFPEDTNLAHIINIDAKAFRHGDTIVLTGATVGPTGFEYPEYDPKNMTRSAQHVYDGGTYDQWDMENVMCKIGMLSGYVCVRQTKRDDELFSEQVFVFSKNDGEEDQGLVFRL